MADPTFDLNPVDFDPFADATDIAKGVPVEQRKGRLIINPQPQQTAPTGLPPPQETPPAIQEAIQHQQDWGMPPAPEYAANAAKAGVEHYITGPISRLNEEGQGLWDRAHQPDFDPAAPENARAAFDISSNLAGIGSQFAEKGAAGIFGGRLSKTADANALGEAQRLEKEGVSPTQIWYQTGWGRGRDAQWRNEIDDSESRWLKQPGPTLKDTTPLSQVLDHPLLYKAYPELANMPVGSLRRGAASWGEYYPPSIFSSRPEQINIQRGIDDPRSTLLHEIQHSIQEREGFGAGANPSSIGEIPYRATSGEVEARNVSKRQDWNAERRQYTPPWLSEDRPYLSQDVRTSAGAVVSKGPGVWDTNPQKIQPGNMVMSADPHALMDALRGTNPEQYRGTHTALPEESSAKLNPLSVPEATVQNGQLVFKSGADSAKWARDRDVSFTPLQVSNAKDRNDIYHLLAEHGDGKAIEQLFHHYDQLDAARGGDGSKYTKLTEPELDRLKSTYLAFKEAQKRRWEANRIGVPTTPEKPAGMTLPPKGEGAGTMASAPIDKKQGQMAEAPPGWISQRLPTGKGAKENPFKQPLLIGADAMRLDPEQWEHHIDLTRDYPNFVNEARREGANAPEDAESQYRRMVDQIKDNLRFVYNGYKKFADRSKLWYDGANKIATAAAEKYNLTVPQVAAVYAAMSPQKDWFQNVSLGNRVLDIWHTKQDFKFTPKMMATAKRIYRATSKDPEKAAIQKAKAEEMINTISKGTLGQMKTIDDQAAWLRAYDETYNKQHYPIISPEGEEMELQTTDAGKPRKMAWGSIDQIGKAIESIKTDDPARLSELMGERHKVRNFYNNILHPNANMGDVTIDTHAVAAALMRPLSGNSTEVLHNFKTSPDKKKRPPNFRPSRGSAITGAQGTYGIYADAYRELAGELGILPRELQSITWEGIRGLFEAEAKRGSLPDIVDQIWKRNDLTPAQKRIMIRDQAGGFRPPDWHNED